MPDFLVTSWRLPRNICYGEVTGKLVPVESELYTQKCTGCGCQIIHEPHKKYHSRLRIIRGCKYPISGTPVIYSYYTAVPWHFHVRRQAGQRVSDEENDAGMAFSNGDWTVRQCGAVNEWNRFSDSIGAIQRSSCCCGELLAGANPRSRRAHVNRNALPQLPTASPPLRYTRHLLISTFGTRRRRKNKP